MILSYRIQSYRGFTVYYGAHSLDLEMEEHLPIIYQISTKEWHTRQEEGCILHLGKYTLYTY